RDAGPLQRLVEALGGAWAEIAEAQRLLNIDARAHDRNPTVRVVRDELASVLESFDPGSQLPDDAVKRVRDVTRVESGWEVLKRGGIRMLSGEAHERAVQLMEELKRIGLFVVEVGEIERFFPAAAGLHGPAWLARAFDGGAHKAEEPRRLVDQVERSFG
ncbi:MAG: hypothetical protein ACREA0_27535, partial [bacterium]